jgi:hypothetical protein
MSERCRKKDSPVGVGESLPAEYGCVRASVHTGRCKLRPEPDKVFSGESSGLPPRLHAPVVRRPQAAVKPKGDGLPLAAINALIEAAHRTHDVTFKIEGRAAVIIIEPQDAEPHPLLGRRAENLE